jgi:uncharacterized membrane protein
MTGRDPAVGLMTATVANLPADTPPGLVGALVDERADVQDVLATLVDLARRGYLTITELDTKAFWGASRDFSYRLTDKSPADLRRYEQLFISHFFGGRRERKLSSLKDKFYATLPQIKNAIYAELVSAGYFQASPESTRSRYTTLGIFLLAIASAGGLLIGAWLSDYVDAIFCPFAGLGLTAVAVLIGGQHMPHKTRQGAEAAAIWRGFKNYLAQLDKYQLPESGALFEQYLPYAVAFGLERSVIRKFLTVPTPMPTWYMPHHPHLGSSLSGASPISPLGKEGPASVQQMSNSMAGSIQGMSDGLIAMVNSASRTFTSQPSSSSSGGFSGGGVGGGGGSRGFR